jgi:hypothetical protein
LGAVQGLLVATFIKIEGAVAQVVRALDS